MHYRGQTTGFMFLQTELSIHQQTEFHAYMESQGIEPITPPITGRRDGDAGGPRVLVYDAFFTRPHSTLLIAKLRSMRVEEKR
jgi:hypothetical protein